MSDLHRWHAVVVLAALTASVLAPAASHAATESAADAGADGLPVRNLLSFLYDSLYSLRGGALRCDDMRAGCP